MIPKKATYLFVCFMVLSLAAWGQADSTGIDSLAVDDSPVGMRPDSLQTDSARADSVTKIFKVFPWKYHKPLDSREVSSDSTLRWQNWPNWTYKKNRDPGVISYRLGTIERTNAYQVDAQEPRYQRLFWEDISLNDPVSGTVNWDFIPIHKLNAFYEENNGLFYDSNYYLRQYYLNKPLTKLNYDESKYDYRSLEFMVSQNFSQRTNAEISYWDRRGGGEFDNSNVAGNQIFARLFHQLGHRQALKLKFLNNKYTIGEPFGYGISDLENFAFNRFIASADESNAESEIKGMNISLSYYLRGEDTTRVTDNFHAGLFMNKRSRELTYSADSTFYQVQSFGANARKWIDLKPLSVEAGASYEYFLNKDLSRSNIGLDNWSVFRGDGELVLSPLGFIALKGGGAYSYRSDGYDSYRFDTGAELSFGNFLRIEGGASQGTIMPTPQQLYWSSNEYRGDEGLQNQEITEARGRVSIRPFSTLELGIKGQYKEIENAVMIRADSTFGNVSPYESLSATPYFIFNNHLFEISGSATLSQFQNKGDSRLLDENERVWLKGSFYIKGTVFNRAAYVKAGFAGMYSPYRYRAGHYNPVLDFWQPLSNDQLLPAFNRLDFDISARVRTILFLLRWENILDDVNQLGYFETAGYPMSQRRFIFGVRAFFRN